jgi:hypothetical protein
MRVVQSLLCSGLILPGSSALMCQVRGQVTRNF